MHLRVSGSPIRVAQKIHRVHFEPDGRTLFVPEGQTLLEAARQAGIPLNCALRRQRNVRRVPHHHSATRPGTQRGLPPRTHG